MWLDVSMERLVMMVKLDEGLAQPFKMVVTSQRCKNHLLTIIIVADDMVWETRTLRIISSFALA